MFVVAEMLCEDSVCTVGRRGSRKIVGTDNVFVVMGVNECNNVIITYHCVILCLMC